MGNQILHGSQSMKIKKRERDNYFESLENDSEWEDVLEKHPNPDAYIHENARFFKSIKS